MHTFRPGMENLSMTEMRKAGKTLVGTTEKVLAQQTTGHLEPQHPMKMNRSCEVLTFQ